MAAAYIKSGGIVAFPTETVYGLGAGVFDEPAIAKIFEAKRRPADNPLIAHISGHEQVGLLAADVPAGASVLMEAFFPGPLTIVLQRSPAVPRLATAGLDTIGIRMPRYPLAQSFLLACGTPVVAPSANLSGRPSPTTWQAVLEDLDGRIDCILQSSGSEIGLESTVVDCTGDAPILLRPGAITLEQLRQIVPGTVSHEAADEEAPRSPGMKHAHYTPRASVWLVAPGEAITPARGSAYIGTGPPAFAVGVVCICSSPDEYARRLFEFFRECDRGGVEYIYCETVAETGIGAAVMDRLRRASTR